MEGCRDITKGYASVACLRSRSLLVEVDGAVSGWLKLVAEIDSLHYVPCPPHPGCGSFGMVAISEGDLGGAAADAAILGERVPDRVVDLHRRGPGTGGHCAGEQRLGAGDEGIGSRLTSR
jgi:hypothetical protein